MHKILQSIREILQFFPKWKKVIDVRKKYVIIICSAIKIPEQSYDAQYRTGGEVRCESMSNVIVKENESLDSALRRFKRNCAKAGIQQEIRKREHYEKPRNLKLLENVSITNMCRNRVSNDTLFFYRHALERSCQWQVL